jgi:hypothetical protein
MAKSHNVSSIMRCLSRRLGTRNYLELHLKGFEYILERVAVRDDSSDLPRTASPRLGFKSLP